MAYKTDVGIAALIGFFISLFFFVVARNLGAPEQLLLLALPLFPALSALGMLVALILGRRLPILAQFAKFFLVGALNTFVDLGALNLLILLTAVFAGPWFSIFKGVSFTVAVINSYAWNKFWTFRTSSAPEARETGKEFAQFMLVSVIGFFVNVGTASLVVNVAGPQFGASPALWANIGAVSAVALSMVWNFTGYKFFVFKK